MLPLEYQLTLTKQTEIAPSIYELCLTGDLAQQPIAPGQFVDIKIPSDAHFYYVGHLGLPTSTAKLTRLPCYTALLVKAPRS